MRDDIIKKNVRNKCLGYITDVYLSDSVELLDNVLTDDQIDPQYSANTAYFRLETYVLLRRLSFDDSVKNVDEFMLNSGYTEIDVKMIHKLRKNESPLFFRDNRTSLDFQFFSVGQTLDDVKAFDPNGDYIYIDNLFPDVPKHSRHYTSDGFVVKIIFDDNDVIASIQVEDL
ncbi:MULTISPECIES: hypothetical protein [unclassified Ruminococcus]|uniref:hypothetical protein n=1 Tax=unclassified Ruminococcus TaxID=2608920 RepID=UPI002108D2BF|nr:MULTISPECIES: hypothetical protein [unclassified Ruminococcus]MCQ4021698.1 hypothetical protein [Ruminococcus sp. zg-924]MCQ4114143.1 hypothetical protein [Ruminococcus sp. zg-921]